MKWPWTKLETRADTSYTDALIAALVSKVTNNDLALTTATAALERCVGMCGRAFAAAEVEGRESLVSALTPDTLEVASCGVARWSF